MSKKVRVGELIQVNKNPKKTFAGLKYEAVIVKRKGIYFTLMFTEEEIEEGIDRALRNFDNIPERSLISKILD